MRTTISPVPFLLEGDIKVHPIAEQYFLPPSDDDTERIALSIKRQGTIEPVTTYEGLLLDGQLRDKASVEHGLDRWAVRFEDTQQGIAAAEARSKEVMDQAAGDYAINKNLARHHYSQGQLAAMAYKMANMPQGARTDLEHSPALGKVSQAKAAERCGGVSSGLISNAGRIYRDGTPEQIRLMEAGSPIEPIVKEIKRKQRAREKAARNKSSSSYTESRIICGDALAVLRTLPDPCAQTCVTSPPYFGLRDYQMEGQIGLEERLELYVRRLVAVFREVRRVLKDDGTLWIVIGDSYMAAKNCAPAPQTIGGQRGMPLTVPGNRREQQGLKSKDLIGIPFLVAFALRADGWYWRDTIIWHKLNPMPESVTDRTTKCHEYMFMFAKSEHYYYDHEAIQEPALCAHDSRAGMGRIRCGGKRNGEDGTGQESFVSISAMRNKRSVWTVPLQANGGPHIAPFPPKLIEPCILAGAQENDVVLDPFLGSGTTAAVAKELGRDYIGIELNLEYVSLAQQRVAETEVQKRAKCVA